jgi:hypothetical protein
MARMRRPITPLGALVRGLLAGAAGTAAMDLLWYRRYRRDGGAQSFPAWELALGLDSWEKAPAPAQVGRRLVEGLFQVELSPRWAMPMTNLMHWGYGEAWAGMYGIAAGTAGPFRVQLGPPFGATVWLSSYVVLPLAGLYKPIWQYDLPTLGKDLSAHLVFGSATALAFAALSLA